MVGACGIALAITFALVETSGAHQVVDPGLAPNIADPLPSGAVARVGATLVSGTDFQHWLAVGADTERPGPSTGKIPPPGRRLRALTRETMRFLILEQWVRLEAPEHRVSVSKRDVSREFVRVKRQTFLEEADFRRFLRDTGMSVADAIREVRFSLLYTRLRHHGMRGQTTRAGRRRADDRFNGRIRRKWRAQTACAHDNKIDLCSHDVPTLPAI